MISHLQQFAETAHGASAEAGGDIFSSLGINGQMLLFQTLAFLILVFLLGKFVFPVLMKAVDDRQAKIDAGQKAAQEAQEKAANATEEVAKMLKQARDEAKDIVATAKDEATAMVAESEAKAKTRAEKIAKDAHDQLEKDIIAARKQLRSDTIELVALATEKVVGKAVSADIDKKIIAAAIKEEA